MKNRSFAVSSFIIAFVAAAGFVGYGRSSPSRAADDDAGHRRYASQSGERLLFSAGDRGLAASIVVVQSSASEDAEDPEGEVCIQVLDEAGLVAAFRNVRPNEIRVEDGWLWIRALPPVPLKERWDIEQARGLDMPDLFEKKDPADYAAKAIETLMGRYRAEGRAAFLETPIAVMLGELPAHMVGPLDEPLVAPWRRSGAWPDLPEAISAYELCPIPASQVVAPFFWRSKYWEVLVYARLFPPDRDDVTGEYWVEFLVSGDPTDRDRILGVALTGTFREHPKVRRAK